MASSSEFSFLEAKSVSKSYWIGSRQLEVLHQVDLRIYPGESVCVMGPSGAGKSTLLHILGTLDRPTAGAVFWGDEDLGKYSDERLAEFRNEKMGFVFQFHHLLPEFSALENVMMPGRIAGQTVKEAKLQAEKWLDELGLRSRERHFPNELSGGEQQRVAIARALVRQPAVLFADEPTGNLDSANSQNIQALFRELQRKYGLTLVVVTHDEGFARAFERLLVMRDGKWSSLPSGAQESALFSSRK